MNNINEVNIFSASEAHEMLENEIKNDNSCLIPIMDVIKKAIKRKENSCYIKDEKEYVLNKLRELGYKVGEVIPGDRPFDSSNRKISW